MAWNEPGGNKNDPWKNRGGKDQGPPDLNPLPPRTHLLRQRCELRQVAARAQRGVSRTPGPG